MSQRKIQCQQLILHSGGIPKELIATDFEYLHKNCKVKLIYGTEDEYLNAERISLETTKSRNLFGNRFEILPFNGKHIVNVDLINSLV
jgi:hypothetical protein